MLYVWGHANDDGEAGWAILEAFAAEVKDRDDIWKATNIEIRDYEKARQMLIINSSSIVNLSNVDVYVKVNGQPVIVPANGVYR